jgi:NAD(P)-dependent dehydrogenase (short-subunit alcohol dehydrogenase family)
MMALQVRPLPKSSRPSGAQPRPVLGSAIVMTGSVTGLLGNKHLLDYSMTKSGIHSFVRSLASHLIDKGIRVNAVAPGPVWTHSTPPIAIPRACRSLMVKPL